MDVDRAQLDLALGAPDAVKQLPAAEHAARAFHEEFEQPVFGRAELQGAPAARHLVRHRIERDIADLDALTGQRGPNTAHDRGHAREQFARGEGLGEVIVGARIETAHAVILGLARGQHDDRDVRGFLVAAQAATDLDPAGPFDHPVENDEIGDIFGGEQQRFIAIGGRADLIAFIGKAVLEQFGEGGIVLYQEQFGGVQILAFPGKLSLGRHRFMTFALRFCVNRPRREDSFR